MVSDNAGARALGRAAAAGIPAVTVALEPGESRQAYDRRLAGVVAAAEPRWVVLAGWMRLLGMGFLGRFPNMVINLHPALPGEFAGTNAIERAFAEALAGIRDHTGVMVHLVPDEGVDDGPVLSMATVAIRPGTDTLESLTERVHDVEHRLLVETLAGLTSTEARTMTEAGQ